MARKVRKRASFAYKTCSNRGANLRTKPSSKAGFELVECRVVEGRTGAKPTPKKRSTKKATAKKSAPKTGGKRGQIKMF